MDNREKMVEELKKKHTYYSDIFSLPSGKKIIDDLEEKYYINRSTSHSNEEIDMFLRGMREGERTVVLYIKNMISDKQLKALGVSDAGS